MNTEELSSFFNTLKKVNNQNGGSILESIETKKFSMYGGQEKSNDDIIDTLLKAPENKDDKKAEEEKPVPETIDQKMETIKKLLKDVVDKQKSQNDQIKSLEKDKENLERSKSENEKASKEMKEKIDKQTKALDKAKELPELMKKNEESKETIQKLKKELETINKENRELKTKDELNKKEFEKLENEVADAKKKISDVLKTEFQDVKEILSSAGDRAAENKLPEKNETQAPVKNQDAKPEQQVINDPFKRPLEKQQGGEIDDLLNFSEAN